MATSQRNEADKDDECIEDGEGDNVDISDEEVDEKGDALNMKNDEEGDVGDDGDKGGDEECHVAYVT